MRTVFVYGASWLIKAKTTSRRNFVCFESSFSCYSTLTFEQFIIKEIHIRWFAISERGFLLRENAFRIILVFCFNHRVHFLDFRWVRAKSYQHVINIWEREYLISKWSSYNRTKNGILEALVMRQTTRIVSWTWIFCNLHYNFFPITSRCFLRISDYSSLFSIARRSRDILSQSELKANWPIMTCSEVFPRAGLCRLHAGLYLRCD